MRIVSWLVVIISLGWLLAYNLWPVVGDSSLAGTNAGRVAGTAVAEPRRPQPLQPDAFARAYTEAWNSHDPARVAAFFASDGVITINDGEPYEGRDAVAAMASGFMRDFPDIHLTMTGLDKQGGVLVYHWRFTGTNVDTGNPVDISGSETWRLAAGGLIEQSLGRFDASDYERQVKGRD